MLILPSLIGMHDQSIYREKALKRLFKNILNLLHVWIERKSVRNNFIYVHVQDEWYIAFSSQQRELRHIRRPLLHQLLCDEISVDDIVRNFANIASVQMIFSIETLSSQPELAHDTLNMFMVDSKVSVQKFLIYSYYAISPSIFFKDCNNFDRYIHISLLHFICFSNLKVVCWFW